MIWNYSALAATHVDRFITMSTYTSNLTSFVVHASAAVDAFGVDQLGVGLASYHLDTNATWAAWELQGRFALIEYAAVQEVDIWLSPVPDQMMPYLRRFVQPPK